MDPTLAANSDNKEDVKEYIGNGEHYVLRDVSFVIEPGEKVAFVGDHILWSNGADLEIWDFIA